MNKASIQLFRAVAAGSILFLCPGVHAGVVVSSQPTQNMNCSGGVCAPTAGNAVLNVGDLETLLASGNVEVTTTGSGVQADNIRLDAALNWSSADGLTLDARKSVSIDQAMKVAGPGGLTVEAGSPRSRDTFFFGANGSITFKNPGSSLQVNGKAFTLVNSLPALAAAVDGNPGGAYALANDYDASQDDTYRASPIDVLNGAIEGLGNTISNLSIDVTDDGADEGLVDQVGEHGSIANLRLVNIDYQADSTNYNGAGGLVARNAGYLFADEISGTITSSGTSQSAGGIAGYNGYDFSGHIRGTIEHCLADVGISGSGTTAGGMVGWNTGTIELSSAEGNVTGGLVGGLVGQNEGPVSQSFSTGAVSGAQAGGFVGNNTIAGNTKGTIVNSYSTGAVTGGEVGGFVSQNANKGPKVFDSYSTGAVPSGAGGFACDATSTSTNFHSDHWNTTTSGTTYAGCFDANLLQTTGLTTWQLRKKLPHGFDKRIWAEDPKINSGFPYLIANPPVKK